MNDQKTINLKICLWQLCKRQINGFFMCLLVFVFFYCCCCFFLSCFLLLFFFFFFSFLAINEDINLLVYFTVLIALDNMQIIPITIFQQLVVLSCEI